MKGGYDMKDFQQRVVNEKNELDFKIEALTDFIGASVFPGLNSEEQKRLKRQCKVMMEYSDILNDRISAF